MTMSPMHLHLLFHMPKALEGVSIGYSMCGRRVPRAQLTKWIDDTTCPACLQRVQKESAPAEDQSAVPKPHNSKLVIKQGASDDDH